MATESSILQALLKQQSVPQMMARQAMSTAPNPSVGAGIAQALMGGIAGLTERGERSRDMSERLAMAQTEFGPDPGSAPTPMAAALTDQPPSISSGPRPKLASYSPAQPSPAPPAPMGPMPGTPNARVADAFGDVNAAIKSGTFDPQGSNNLPPPPTRMASALAGMPQSGPPMTPQPSQAPLTPPAPQAPQQAPMAQMAEAGQPPERTVPKAPPNIVSRYYQLLRSESPEAHARAEEMMAPYRKPQDQFRSLTDPAEKARRGISPDDKNAYQIGTNNEIKPVNPQPFAVNVNNQAESEFSKKSAEHQAKRYDDLAAEGPAAKQMQSDVAMLRDLGQKINTGKTAEVKAVIGPYAEALGIKVDGLSEIQAYEAIVNRVAPNLRVKGTGAQSDFELRNFIKQIPSIGNNPEGNALIERTLQGMISNKMKASEIGSQALNGEITRKEADKQLRELPDPMEEWRKEHKKFAEPAKPTVIDGYTIKRK